MSAPLSQETGMRASPVANERGMALANRCAEILEAAELRVTRVLDDGPADLDEPAF